MIKSASMTVLRLVVPRPVRERVQGRRRNRHRIVSVEVIVHRQPGQTDGSAVETTMRSVGTAAQRCRDLGLRVVVRTSAEAGAGVRSDGPRHIEVHLLAGVAVAAHAFTRLVAEFNNSADLELCYSDGAGSGDSEPILLPGHSPERLVQQMYLGHMLAFRYLAPGPQQRRSCHWAEVAEQARGVRTAAHIPERLYSVAADAELGCSAEASSSDSITLAANLAPEPAANLAANLAPEPAANLAVKPAVVQASSQAVYGSGAGPLVSIVVPTRGDRRVVAGRNVVLVEQAVASVLNNSTYKNIELVVVTTPGTPAETAGLVEAVAVGSSGHATVIRDDRPFNFSNACNRGALVARGDVLVFLNDDTEVINRDWLEHLLAHATKSQVGAVGARLLYENSTVQHCGIWCRGGHPIHRYEGAVGDELGYRGALTAAQNCLAVTGACLAVERSKFMAVGGFSPIFPNSYNDVDLCLKLLDRGWRTVVEPRATLHHYEASSRDPYIADDDMALLHDRWRWRLNHDPFDNPTHQARLSEERPLPDVAYRLSTADERRDARYWPLPPVTLGGAEITELLPTDSGRSRVRRH